MEKKDLVPDIYLDKDFDYKKLTKTALKKILFENNINVRSNALKQELIDLYKTNIFDKIDELKLAKRKEVEKMENIYQSDRSSVAEIDLNDRSNLLSTERVLRKHSASGKAIAHNSAIFDEGHNESSSSEIKRSASFINTPSKNQTTSKLSFIRNRSNNINISSDEELEKDLKKPNKYSITKNATPIKKIVTKDQTDIQNKPKSPIKKRMESSLAQKIDFNNQTKKNEHEDILKVKIEPKNITQSRLEQSKIDQRNFEGSKIDQKNAEQIRLEQRRIKQKNPEQGKIQKKDFEKSRLEQKTPEYKNESPKIDRKPLLSNKEQLKRLISEDMQRRKHDDNSLADSSITNYSGTSFSNVESYVTNKTDITEALSDIPVKKSRIYYVIITIILLVVYGILKMLPYSDGKCFFCVNVPENGKLINGKLVCDKGYIYKKSLFKNACMKDDTKEKSRRKLIGEILKKLEFKNGDFMYGRSKTSRMLISDLTTDEEIIQELIQNPNVKIFDKYISSVKYKVSLRAFIHFYSKKMVILLLPLLLFIFTLKYYQTRRRIRRENEEESKRIIKDVLNVLLRQLIISTKNTRFPEYVYIDQLRDVFGDNTDVWNIVQKKVSSNSNVSTIKMDKRYAWQWIGPILRRKESLENMQL
ncbi:hypothetical protein P3W45_001433 [Vairimorpha bombi]|jgi:hypothetical protein